MIQSERRPDCPASVQSCFRLAPRLGSGFAVVGHSVESPDLVAVREFESADPTFDSLLADAESQDNQIFEDQRRDVKSAFVLFRHHESLFPQQSPLLRIERKKITVGGCPDDSALLDSNAAVRRP